MYKNEYEPANETFEEFEMSERWHYLNPFQLQGQRRFSSLERQRLVYSMIVSKTSEDGAELAGSKNREAFGDD